MKISKFLYYSAYVLLMFIAFSCMEDEDPKIKGYNYFFEECTGTNYVLNQGETECICPEGTHYQLEPVTGNDNEVTSCIEILEGSFLYKADLNTCLYDVRNTEVEDWFSGIYDKTGMAEFNFENKSLFMVIGNSGSGQRQSWNLFGAGTIEIEENQSGMFFHEDGSFSVVYFGFGNENRNCSDWVDRDPDCNIWRVETRGRSNPERTSITLNMTWQNCRREVIDTGTIEMWKEW